MISSKEKSKQIIKKHSPFLVFLFRKAKYPYWILRKIYKENEKIHRNQWSIGNEKLYGEPTDIDYSAEYSRSVSGYFNTYLRIGNFNKKIDSHAQRSNKSIPPCRI